MAALCKHSAAVTVLRVATLSICDCTLGFLGCTQALCRKQRAYLQRFGFYHFKEINVLWWIQPICFQCRTRKMSIMAFLFIMFYKIAAIIISSLWGATEVIKEQDLSM